MPECMGKMEENGTVYFPGMEKEIIRTVPFFALFRFFVPLCVRFFAPLRMTIEGIQQNTR